MGNEVSLVAKQLSGQNVQRLLPSVAVRHATVLSVETTATCTIKMSGDSISRAGISYIIQPVVGATVIVLEVGTDLIVAGSIIYPTEYETVFEYTLPADAAQIDTGATIPTGYKTLEVELVGQSTGAATAYGNVLRINGDSASDYDVQQLYANGAAVSAARGSNSGMSLGDVAGAGGTTQQWSFNKIEIGNYCNVPSLGARKPFITVAEGYVNTSPFIYEFHESGTWRSSTGITQLTWVCLGANFKAGSYMRVKVK